MNQNDISICVFKRDPITTKPEATIIKSLIPNFAESVEINKAPITFPIRKNDDERRTVASET